MLTIRNVEILKAIVEEFIESAEPVGSKTLVQKYHLPYSSATIRNDMATLEMMGYLEKPHTSAGRVPSNKGYQFYCEHLIKKETDEDVKYAISNIFSKPTMNLDDAIKESCRVISDMTNLTSGVLGPDANGQLLEHIKLFPIDAKTAVCVFITNIGHTENKVFNFKDEVSLEDIKNCTEVLNDRLKGTPIVELQTKMASIKPILSQYVKRHEMLFNAFYGAFVKFASENLYFSGTSNMMYQPEFSDLDRLKELMRIMDDSKLFKQMLSNENQKKLVLKTHDGTDLVWLDDIAVVSSNIRIGENEKARLMVVGPNRMQYDRILGLLDYISQEIEKFYK